MPVGIKDVTPTRGIRTTYGSTLFADHVPEEDALVVQRLRAAGAIVIGKTNTPEFAFGPNTVNALFGATRNPWNPALSAGGSSGGSAAALATGMCTLAEGTDLGGSLRGPASFCGVVGFRTTPGLIPRYPSVLAWDTYSVEGPMARSVADTALMLSVMAGPDDRAPLSYPVDPREFVRAVRAPSIKGCRIAWTPDLGGLVPVDREVQAVFERAVGVFRAAGARTEAACPDMSDVPEIVRLTRGFLMVARHADKLPQHRAVLQAGLVENTDQGLALSAREIAEGELLRTRQWQRVREFLARRDLWVTPTAAVPPFPIGEPHAIEVNGQPLGKGMARSYLTYAFSVLGLPAISIPAGFTGTGSRWGSRSSASPGARPPSFGRPRPSRPPTPGPAAPRPSWSLSPLGRGEGEGREGEGREGEGREGEGAFRVEPTGPSPRWEEGKVMGALDQPICSCKARPSPPPSP